VNSGRMKQYITIRKKTSGAWGSSESWADYFSCYAEIIFDTGKESSIEDQMKSINTGIVKMRYDSRLTPDMRISWHLRIFEIKNILNISEKNREFKILISEIKR
jgi:SPP1 family predicted phage head-tail adaptor